MTRKMFMTASAALGIAMVSVPSYGETACKSWRSSDVSIDTVRDQELAEYRVESSDKRYVAIRSFWHGSADMYCHRCGEDERAWTDVALRIFDPRGVPLPAEQLPARLAKVGHQYLQDNLRLGGRWDDPLALEAVTDLLPVRFGALTGSLMRFAIRNERFSGHDIVTGLGNDGCVEFRLAVLAKAHRGDPPLGDIQAVIGAITISRQSREISAAASAWLHDRLQDMPR